MIELAEQVEQAFTTQNGKVEEVANSGRQAVVAGQRAGRTSKRDKITVFCETERTSIKYLVRSFTFCYCESLSPSSRGPHRVCCNAPILHDCAASSGLVFRVRESQAIGHIALFLASMKGELGQSSRKEVQA